MSCGFFWGGCARVVRLAGERVQGVLHSLVMRVQCAAAACHWVKMLDTSVVRCACLCWGPTCGREGARAAAARAGVGLPCKATNWNVGMACACGRLCDGLGPRGCCAAGRSGGLLLCPSGRCGRAPGQPRPQKQALAGKRRSSWPGTAGGNCKAGIGKGSTRATHHGIHDRYQQLPMAATGGGPRPASKLVLPAASRLAPATRRTPSTPRPRQPPPACGAASSPHARARHPRPRARQRLRRSRALRTRARAPTGGLTRRPRMVTRQRLRAPPAAPAAHAAPPPPPRACRAVLSLSAAYVATCRAARYASSAPTCAPTCGLTR